MSIRPPNHSRRTFGFSALRFLASGFCIFALTLLGAGVASAAIQSYTADTATLHLWHFDETSAPCVDSIAGGTNLAFLIGGVNVGSAGLSNNAVNFKKALNFGPLTTSNAIAMPAGSGNVGTASPFTYAGTDGAFTFEALLQINFNPTNFVRAQPCQVLNCDVNGTGTRVFQFRLLPVGYAGGGGDTNFVRIEFINGTATAAVVPIPTNGPDVIASNQWYHLALTFNGVANTASNLLFYWTLLDTNRATANLIYATNLASDLPGVSSAANNSFTILTDGAGMSGTFTNILNNRVPVANYAGGSFLVVTTATSVVLTNFQVLLASFTASATNGASPLSVNFTDTSVGSITNRSWNFGDGFTTNTTATSLTHTFTSTGTNLVTLSVSGASGTNAASLAVVVLGQPPVIGGIQISGGDLIITGTNGTAGQDYLVLATTNLALAATNWTMLATNQFGPGGRVNFTNPLDPNSPQTFYRLRLP